MKSTFPPFSLIVLAVIFSLTVYFVSETKSQVANQDTETNRLYGKTESCKEFRRGPLSKYDFIVASTREELTRARTLRSGPYEAIKFRDEYVPKTLRSLSGGSDFEAVLFSIHPETRQPYHRPLLKYVDLNFVAPTDDPSVSVLVHGFGQFKQTEEMLNIKARRSRLPGLGNVMLDFGTYRVIGAEHGLLRVDFPNDSETTISRGELEAWVRRDEDKKVTLSLTCIAAGAAPNPSCTFYKNIDQFSVKVRFNKKFLHGVNKVEQVVDSFVRCLTKD